MDVGFDGPRAAFEMLRDLLVPFAETDQGSDFFLAPGERPAEEKPEKAEPEEEPVPPRSRLMMMKREA